MKVNGKTGEVTMAWRDRRAIVLHRAAFMCEECHKATATEVDHIWPRSWGGQDDLSNLRATCLPCNRSKAGKAYVMDITWERARWTERKNTAGTVNALLAAARWQLVKLLMAHDELSGEEAFHEAHKREISIDRVTALVVEFLGDLEAEFQAAADQARAADQDADPFEPVQ